MPDTKVVPTAGTMRTSGLPPIFTPFLLTWFGSGVKPAGCSSTPAKIAARMTLTKVKKAERVASLERVSKVRGSEQTNEMSAPMAAKPTVQTAWVLIVFK